MPLRKRNARPLSVVRFCASRFPVGASRFGVEASLGDHLCIVEHSSDGGTRPDFCAVAVGGHDVGRWPVGDGDAPWP